MEGQVVCEDFRNIEDFLLNLESVPGIVCKAFSAEKGARFRGKWGLGASPPPPHPPSTPGPSPPPPPPFLLGCGGGFAENPGGGGSSRERGGGDGQGCVQGIWGGGGGGAEAPFTVKMSPVFGENAFCKMKD